MDNSNLIGSDGLQASLFPLEPREMFEMRTEDASASKQPRSPIFANQIRAGGKSNLTPVPTPLKGAKTFGMESVLRSPARRTISYGESRKFIGTPTREASHRDAGSGYLAESKPIFESTIKPEQSDAIELISPALIKDALTEVLASKPDGKPRAARRVNGRPQAAVDVLALATGTPSLPISKLGCNCKNSQCLKLYCECFRNQSMCKNCSCVNCANKTSNNARRTAISAIKAKNPGAFDPKFTTTKTNGTGSALEPDSKMAVIISRGCKCKNSNCTKKYCECFQYGLGCSANCSCLGCENGKAECDISAISGAGTQDAHAQLAKRSEFDVRGELIKKLLEIKKFKLSNC